MLKTLLDKASRLSFVLLPIGCTAYCTLEFVADFVVCSGPSMQPGINSDDILLTEHLSVARKKIARGDVVIARSPSNPKQHVCKRVIKLEGDRIENPPTTYSRSFIPKGHVWLEGDNKQNSTDSRTYGPVPYGLIRSKVFCKIWPLRDIRSFPRDR